MLRLVFCACVVPIVVAIIVTDYPPTSTEYNYSYNVVNPSTGDAKSLHEVRQDGVVRGSYSLIDPDGTRRTVKYTAGPRTGFKAVVQNEPASPAIQRYQPATFSPGQMPFVRTNTLSATYLPVARKTNPVFFTPGNSAAVNRPVFNHGEYFSVNKSYQTNRI